jgi:hypothetical protein
MIGTTGSKFTVLAQFVSGLIGFRALGGGAYRVRVEPAEGISLSFPLGWKTPGGGQNRFSIVTADLAGAVNTAVAILTAAAVESFEKTPEPEETDDAEDIDEIDDGKMYGTSGAEFNVVGEFIAGRVGYRHIGNGEVRVRVEPADGMTLSLSDWKQPDCDGNRYSKVGAASTLNDLLVTAGKALADASIASALGTATLAKAA